MFFGKDDKNKPEQNKYKFKHLLVYGSMEWMANSTKKYRTVYDKSEITYINAELALYNKCFDEEEWKCKVTLKVFDVKEPSKAITVLDHDVTVSKEENIVYVRDGWGNATPGAFWTRGQYTWEAYVDDELVGKQDFFVNDVGKVTAALNPYFNIEYIRLFVGSAEGWNIRPEDRVYYKQINRNTTQYLWCEMKITNLTNLEWNYELFFNYFDDAGQPKAQTSRAGKIESGKKDWAYTFDVGWGNETPGSWKDDKYTLEIVFMDALVGAVVFECGDVAIEGQTQMIKQGNPLIEPAIAVAGATGDDGRSLNELLVELDSLIGLQHVKKRIRDQITFINFSKLRKEQGLDEGGDIKLHSVAIGNPGTGKTTVMRLLGKIYHKMGLLSKGHLNEVDRVDLVGEYIGQTAPKTQKVIDESRGGILFIDEAYSLARSGEDSRDFGKEVIEIIIKEMSDGPGDIAIFVAGYPKEMEAFLESNPGLRSRFGQYFQFDDYLPEELFEIALYIANDLGMAFDLRALPKLKEYLVEAYRRRDKNFGNARFVGSVVHGAKMQLGMRLMQDPSKKYTKEELSTITIEDVESTLKQNEKKRLKLDVNPQDLQLALDELHQLIGMENVKKEIDELVRLISYYNDIGKDVMNKFSLHTIFTGNPGTGKTTIARIMGKIFKALGILERGHVVEVDREQLVAGYVGQTATKTAGKIDEAMGGVLFIDEAYALASGYENDFGREAIEVILKRMEDNRGKFVVFAAGYPDNMNTFLMANPGLNSRFDKKIHFEDYTPEQLWQIGETILKNEGMRAEEPAKQHLQNYFTEMYKNRDKFFGNARAVRQSIDEAIKNQNLRMAALPPQERTAEAIHTLILADVEEFKFSGNLRKTLGFRAKN